jgi:hypothetical protein
MFWVIVAIIIAGWIIASAIKNSVREAHATPEQKAARYNALVEVAKQQKGRELCRLILELNVRGRKSNKQIAASPKVQKKALELGIDISGEDVVREIKMHPDFLVYNDLLEKFKAMVANGDSDEKIAKRLGLSSSISLGRKVYEPEDVAYMRVNILGHRTDEQPNLVQSDWSSFNEQLDKGSKG